MLGDIARSIFNKTSLNKSLPNGTKDIIQFAKIAKTIDWDSISNIDINSLTTPPPICDEKIKSLALSVNHENIYNFFRNIEGFSPINYRASRNEILKDLKSIEKDSLVKEIYHFSEYSTFYISTNDVVMYSTDLDTTFNFGKFYLYFHQNKVMCDTYCDNKLDSSGNFFHPYSNGRLCLGDFEKAYISAMKDGRVLHAFEIVKEVMTIYRGNDRNNTKSGAYAAFFSWVGVRCDICDDLHPLEKTAPCSKDGGNICPKCYKNKDYVDEVSKKVYNPKHLSVCSKCEKRTIDVKKGSCTRCRIKNFTSSKKESE